MSLDYSIPANRIAGLRAGMHPKTIESLYNLQRGVVVKKQFPFPEVNSIDRIVVIELNDNRK